MTLASRSASRRVVLTEVDGFGDIGVGLRPVLADFEDHPRAEFEFALAQQVGDVEQQAGAFLDRGALPVLKGTQSGLHGRFHVFFACFLVNADNFRRLRRIQRFDLVLRLNALAADDEIILAAQLAANLVDGSTHFAGIFFLAEIGERLIREWALMKANLWSCGGFNGCHKCTSKGIWMLRGGARNQLL